ncbi:hypothetical protein J8L70_05470 [Pseudoalteromonas sp. MMG010]|uniref:hypothetical protein n=1 Tax=Pseudoalteromonas sp. MMG010 TaxID=2822685 RepID=UPI001B3A2FE3|nr:hypothetical protein [Pseudoalteromonas sp. MMG010]MBQ4832685.1 hypothetical protein [Pseudoalteromonas sp. MMG010]
MKLGRKGWNNVIIFSMLIMIFFLNGWHKSLFNQQQAPSMEPILPIQSFVLTVKFADQMIERIGTSWRIKANQTSQWQPSEQQISELINRWQTLTLMPEHETVVFNPKAPLYVASFELAGEKLPWVYLLYQGNDRYYLLEKNTQRILGLDLSTAKTLFPSAVFTKGDTK